MAFSPLQGVLEGLPRHPKRMNILGTPHWGKLLKESMPSFGESVIPLRLKEEEIVLLGSLLRQLWGRLNKGRLRYKFAYNMRCGRIVKPNPRLVNLE